MSVPLIGEVQLRDDAGVWRTVRLGSVPVTDRRRIDPLGLTPTQRECSHLSEALGAVNGQPAPVITWLDVLAMIDHYL